jgi:hypothetical protein
MGNNSSAIIKSVNSSSIYPTQNEEPRKGYYTNKNNIIYKSQVFPKLETESNFQKLNYGYFKSNKRVFYNGNLIPGANPETFRIINRDKVKNETENKDIINLNSVIGIDYFGNKKRIYHKGNLLTV